MSAGVNRRYSLAFGALALLIVVGSAVAQSHKPQDPTATLRAAIDADELDLAALTARLGDDSVLEALAEGKDPALRLAAVRATPYLLNQELALNALATIAAGRDPDLAPAAARRALAIAQALELENAAVRELSASELQSAENQLSTLANSGTARRDIRLCAGQAAHLLRVVRGS